MMTAGAAACGGGSAGSGLRVLGLKPVEDIGAKNKGSTPSVMRSCSHPASPGSSPGAGMPSHRLFHSTKCCWHRSH